MGLFSSKIKTDRADVLIKSDLCGYYKLPLSGSILDNVNTPAYNFMYAEYVSSLLWRAFVSSRSCDMFIAGESTTPSCDSNLAAILRKQTNGSFADSCLFDQGTCINLTEGTFEASTGPMDTQLDLGINAPKQNRLTVRKSLTCSVLKTDPYVTSWGFNDTLDSWLDFNYGYSPDAGWAVTTNWPDNNVGADGHVTFRLRSIAYFHPSQPVSIRYGTKLLQVTLLACKLTQRRSVRTSFMGQPRSHFMFDPLPEFNKSDADVNLIFLQNMMGYSDPVYDTWFRTTINMKNMQSLQKLSRRFGCDNNWDYYCVGLLGCTEQYEFCNSGFSRCSGLMSLGQIDPPAIGQKIGLNSRQETLVGHFKLLFPLVTLHNIWNALPPAFLRATSSSAYASSISPPLPSNQWKLEVANWVFSMRVALQQALIDYATGPSTTSPGLESIFEEPFPGSFERDLCSSQLRPDSEHASLNILGIFLIYSVGCTIILLDFFTPLLHKLWMRSRRKHDRNVPDSWLLDDSLHWQQRAFAAARMGKWTGLKDSIPTTGTREMFRPIWYSHAKQNGATTSLSDEDLQIRSASLQTSQFFNDGRRIMIPSNREKTRKAS